jgi:hypothetical protein
MASKPKYFLLLFLTFFCLSGCYTTPTRHLASDIALLQIDKSSREDVLVFLGDPDEQVDLGDGVQKWLYKEYDASFFQKTPLVGDKIGTPKLSQVVVTIRNGVVAACDYSYVDESDMDWSKDFSWQKKKQ